MPRLLVSIRTRLTSLYSRYVGPLHPLCESGARVAIPYNGPTQSTKRLAKVWVHHPTLPRPQFLVSTELEVMELPGTGCRKVHDQIKSEFGKIAFIRGIKALIDDCIEEEKDFDTNEVRISPFMSL